MPHTQGTTQHREALMYIPSSPHTPHGLHIIWRD